MCARPAPPKLLYTMVADLDATVARAEARGAKRTERALPALLDARVAELIGPQGTAFALRSDA